MPRTTLARLAASLRPARRKADVADTDHALLARFTHGKDESAFRALVNRHANTVLAACRQVLTDPADTDDAFQAVFLVLLKKAKSLDATTPLGGWVYAVAHRLAVRIRSDKARRSAREAEAARRAKTVGDAPDLSWKEATAVLHAELNALPDKYRLPLLLCYLQGLTRDEAAEQLGSSVGAVRGQLERGRALLERRLTRRGLVLSAGLLAVMMGSSATAGGPPAALIDLTVSATTGNASPAVSALAHGAFPMTTFKQLVLPAVLVLGLLGAGVGAGLQSPVAHADEKKPADKMDKPKADATPTEANERTISGTVTGHDGKPVAAEFNMHWTEGTVQPLVKTNADGTFKLTVPMKKNGMGGELVATAAGHGPDFHYHGYEWLPASVTPTADLTFKLPKEQPIKGRIISQEGKPVSGATVAAHEVSAYDSDASLDAKLKRWAERADGNPLQGDRGMQYPKTARPPSATTDADGRFELAGYGAGQTVQLKVSGEGIAIKGLVFVNRDGFDAAPLVEAAVRNAGKNHKFNPRWVMCGPDSTAVVEPEKRLRGTVTDQDGKPRAGVKVQATRTTSAELTDHWYWHEATTDKDGKYEIRGLRKYPAYTVTVDPPAATGLMYCTAATTDTVGYEPITLDVKCPRGVIVTGIVTNKATGRPVRSSDIRAEVLKENPFAGQYPAIAERQPQHWSDDDGKFRIVTIPGPVLLIASGGSKNDSEFKPPAADPDYPKYFWESDGGLLFKSQNGQDHLNGCWCKVLNAKAVGDEVAVKIELEPATRASVKVVDADGKPVKGPQATGVEHVEYAHPKAFPDTDTLTVLNLDAQKERLLAVVHAERKLVGTLTLTADTKSPVVTLDRGGTITGRAVGKDGKPITGLTVEAKFTHRPATEAFKAFHQGEPTTTDANGEFRVDGLFPGEEFKLTFSQGKKRFGPEPDKAPKHTAAKPGDTLKLGDMKLEPAKEE